MVYGKVRWAWTIALILSIIGIIYGIASIAMRNTGAIVNVIIYAIIIYYLFRPNVKAFFGKTSTSTPGNSWVQHKSRSVIISIIIWILLANESKHNL